MKKLIVMVAIPGSGKSTFVNREKTPETFVFSTDDYIESRAKEQGKTYSDIFKDTIAQAEMYMNIGLQSALAKDKDVIIDRTNLNKKVRRRVLSQIKKNYEKVAVVIMPPSSKEEWMELNRRLAGRSDKQIPDRVIKSMFDSFEEPSLDEGFDKIEKYDIWGKHVV